MKSIFSIIIMVLTSIVFSQSFITPFKSLPLGSEIIVETSTDEIIKGKLSSGLLAGSKLLSLTVKDESGKKHKFKAKKGEIKKVKIKLGKLAKMALAAESGSSIKGLVKTDFNEVLNREYAILERALQPKKKNKYELMQLLNPGFDKIIKVYMDPKAKETMSIGGVIGGNAKSYLIVKNGAKSYKLKKSKYKKEFKDLFGDCEAMMKELGSDKIKWNDFAEHVFLYDQLCGK